MPKGTPSRLPGFKLGALAQDETSAQNNQAILMRLEGLVAHAQKAGNYEWLVQLAIAIADYGRHSRAQQLFRAAIHAGYEPAIHVYATQFLSPIGRRQDAIQLCVLAAFRTGKPDFLHTAAILYDRDGQSDKAEIAYGGKKLEAGKAVRVMAAELEPGICNLFAPDLAGPEAVPPIQSTSAEGAML